MTSLIENIVELMQAVLTTPSEFRFPDCNGRQNPCEWIGKDARHNPERLIPGSGLTQTSASTRDRSSELPR